RGLLLEEICDRRVGLLDGRGPGAVLGGGRRGRGRGGLLGTSALGPRRGKTGREQAGRGRRDQESDDESARHGAPHGRRILARYSPDARPRRTTATFHWKTACAQRARIWNHAMYASARSLASAAPTASAWSTDAT